MLDSLLIIAFISFVFYFILLSNFVRGWRKIPSSDVILDSLSSQNEKLKPSIIVCFKNEEDNLPSLIKSLQSQSYSHFELIWVNDHSTDNSVQLIESSLANFQNAKLLHSPHQGKKQAQQYGILETANDFIITTDADCQPTTTWIENMVSFQIKEQADLIIAPVKLETEDTLFARLQALEFAILVSSGIASAGMGKAIFCNAANMAFTKQAWLESQQDLHPEEPSGDDVFLLHSVKKRNGYISVLKSPKAMVTTRLQPTLKSFIQQRTRWAAKSSKYQDSDSISTALTVSAINLMLLVMIGMTWFSSFYAYTLAFIFCFKLIAEISFINQLKAFFQLQNSLSTALVLAFVYPFYIVVVMVNAVFRKRGEW